MGQPIRTLAPARTTATTAALTATLGLATVGWIVSVREMDGMDMGVATELGSFVFFTGLWVTMMAAMMLPGAAPAVVRVAHGRDGPRAVPGFVASYLAVWTVVGIVAYALYRPHSTSVAGAVVLGAGLYELTPFKQHFRRTCRERTGSGLEFGLGCVGSSIMLMAALLALGVMSVAWMAVIAAVVVAQKLLRANPAIDVALALAIVGLGIVIVVVPSAIPGITPPM